MIKNSIKVLLSISLIGFFSSGCFNKQEVVTEATKTKPKTKVKKIKKESTADSKIAQIKTNVIEEENLEEKTLNSNNNMEKANESYINQTISEIDGQKIILKSIHFKFDDYHLTDEMVVIANENAQKIDKIISQDPEVKIKLEGNCDEWGTDEYNYALGLKRAKTVKESLIKSGINPKKIVIISYGESNPICNEHTISCWKRNRRVDYKLLP